MSNKTALYRYYNKKEELIYVGVTRDPIARMAKDKPGHYEDDGFWIGQFQCFGSAYKEFKTGAGNYTVAIVEEENGNVHEVTTDCIQFID